MLCDQIYRGNLTGRLYKKITSSTAYTSPYAVVNVCQTSPSSSLHIRPVEDAHLCLILPIITFTKFEPEQPLQLHLLEWHCTLLPQSVNARFKFLYFGWLQQLKKKTVLNTTGGTTSCLHQSNRQQIIKISLSTPPFSPAHRRDDA